MRVPVALYPWQYTILSIKKTLAILVVTISYGGFNLHFPDDIKHLFIFFLAIYISSFAKCLFNSCPLKNMRLFFLLLSRKSSSIFRTKVLCQCIYFKHFFLPICGLCFHFLNSVFLFAFFLIFVLFFGHATRHAGF